MNSKCRKGKPEGECCGGCHEGHRHEEIDVSALGPDAVRLAGLFEDVNGSLISALKTRQKILEMLHESSKSPEKKEALDKVVRSRHPVLIQFVFGGE